eukprot:gb/GFBE01028041.1/.p1 GENE.gb/GFBE01028041.1/~~gb/GFBE01028041.1/.p1  ORF type:complete len:196 (+),score=32.55 gb/GFBE01028041.1/:1-588(+)
MSIYVRLCVSAALLCGLAEAAEISQNLMRHEQKRHDTLQTASVSSEGEVESEIESEVESEVESEAESEASNCGGIPCDKADVEAYLAAEAAKPKIPARLTDPNITLDQKIMHISTATCKCAPGRHWNKEKEGCKCPGPGDSFRDALLKRTRCCEDVDCPPGTSGVSVSSGCSCHYGTWGMLNPMVGDPYYKGGCY